ncbi:MAG TPA: hypothetical protein VFA98_08005 [Thermoanaerobaculia bacterium]|nr:hypothetical protein [Thermoanaerobaculia bacterium]
MNRPGIFALALSLAVAAPALAAGGPARARYSIEFSDGTRVVAVDAPVVRGSVVTFRSSDGTLRGVPREMIVRVGSLDAAPISANTIRALESPAPSAAPDATVVAPPGLQPGEVLVLGPITDSVPSIAQSAAAAGALGPSSGNGTAGGMVANGGASGVIGVGGYAGMPSYGGAVSPTVVNPNLYIAPPGTVRGPDGVPRALSSTDLERAQAAQTTIAPNGFPVTSSGAPTVIGPNGTPTLAPGVPGSGTPAIGPNGEPVVGTTGSTGAFPPIGPNGTPVLAPGSQPGSVQPGQAGSAQPVIGPNGTPVLAPNGQPGSVQPGQPGSAQPVVGPNGTPVLAPNGQPGSAQPTTAPNGTPASPASKSGGAPAASSSGPGH